MDGQPVSWSPEIQSGIWRVPGEHVAYPDPTPGEQELYYIAALAFGLKGLNFYMLVNRENWEHAPLDPGGAPTPALAAVRGVVQVITRLSQLGSFEPVTSVALVWQPSYGRDAYAALAIDRDRRLPYDTTVGSFDELTRAGYLPYVWNIEQTPPTGVVAVVAPTRPYMHRDVQRQRANRARAGSPVFLVGPLPLQDEAGEPCTVLAAAVAAGEVALSRVEDIPGTLRAHGIEPPVSTDCDDCFAILHQAGSQQILFVLNVRAARSSVLLRFANSRIAALKPCTSTDPAIQVTDRVARVELEPHTGLVFHART
jgi:hypothetical protein